MIAVIICKILFEILYNCRDRMHSNRSGKLNLKRFITIIILHFPSLTISNFFLFILSGRGISKHIT